MNTAQHAVFLIILGAASATHLGCKKQDQIRTYRVSKPPSPAAAARKQEDRSADRLLAAMVPHGRQTWFFKVVGRADELDKFADSFRTFVKSIRFGVGKDSTPTWTLPSGWRQRPATGMRFATLQFGPEAHPFEMTVIPLSTPPQDLAGYTVSNVNRWRKQLGLPAIPPRQLADQTERLSLNGATATVVSLLGHRQQSAMMTPPFAQAGQTPRAATGRPAASASNPHARAAAVHLTYKTPKGWTPSKMGGMRKAAFSVHDDGKNVEITVIDLAEGAGDLLANINRWRGQVHLPPTTKAKLDQEITQVKVDKATGHLVELVGPKDAKPRQAILGVVAIHSGRAWFFKLMGNADLAAREKDRFLAFIQSVRFTDGHGVGNSQ